MMGVGRVDDDDAVLGGRLHVDAVDAAAGADHAAALGQQRHVFA